MGYLKESLVVAEECVDKIVEKGAQTLYDKILGIKAKPFGIISTLQTLGEML